MNPTLTEIKNSRDPALSQVVQVDADIAKLVDYNHELMYVVTCANSVEDQSDKLVELEVALRKGRRVGLLKD
jgi:hypothetical protein